MPGIFGGIGCRQDQYENLRNAFKVIWGNCESISLNGGFMGGHAFSNDLALYVTRNGLHFAVDGENSLYKNACKFSQQGDPPLFKMFKNRVEPEVKCKGNVAILDQKYQILYLVSEWTGSFPLYYTQIDGGLLFSSHLRPLSKVIKATPDPVGIMQFMRAGFILEGRTYFKEIKRLLPGQALTYQKTGDLLKTYENSKAWMDWDGPDNFTEIVDHSNLVFMNAMKRCLEYSNKHGLMASGGWDTRILLTAFLKLNEVCKLICYTHGDLESREISITKKIIEDLRIRHHLEAIDGNMYDLQVLQSGFDRVETLYPCFLRAGKILFDAGVECVSAGVIGEVIGGRHGRHWHMLLISEWEKIRFVTPYLLHLPFKKTSDDNNGIHNFFNLLKIEKIQKPWYLRSDFWDMVPNLKDEMYADLEKFFHRQKTRGVINLEKIIEAYTAEYFGAQMLTPQILNCRANTNITIPFADQELYCFTSKIPMSYKILHSLQQAIIRKNTSQLLNYPNSAAFFSAKLPIPLLEVSRVFRKLSESLSWKFSGITGGRYNPKHFAWNNYEKLGKSQALQNMADNLKCSMFDKNTIMNGINLRISQIETNPYMYPLNGMQSKITMLYNVDLMLR